MNQQTCEAIEKMNQEPKQTVVELLENMYGVILINLQEQIEYYKAKEQE